MYADLYEQVFDMFQSQIFASYHRAASLFFSSDDERVILRYIKEFFSSHCSQQISEILSPRASRRKNIVTNWVFQVKEEAKKKEHSIA